MRAEVVVLRPERHGAAYLQQHLPVLVGLVTSPDTCITPGSAPAGVQVRAAATLSVAASAEMSGRFDPELSASGHQLKGAIDPEQA